MDLLSYLTAFTIVTAIALLWARWAQLDLALSRPDFRRAEVWVLLYILWSTFDWATTLCLPISSNPELLEDLAQTPLVDDLILSVLLAPICEELLFRGAMFAAFLRRWGLQVAIWVPSILWALIHIGYNWWVIAMFVVTGALLAMVRWSGKSILLPIVLHAAWNLLVTLYNHEVIGPGPVLW